MKEVCIPFSNIAHNECAEVEVRIPNTGQEWHYRIESFKASEKLSSDSADRVFGDLRNYINTYNKNWELIQIMDTSINSPYVHLLYREKS